MEKIATEKDLRRYKDLRSEAIKNIDVESMVKGLELIPVFNVATTQMVADFYEVGIESVKRTIVNNRDELASNGLYTLTRKMFKETRSVPFIESHRSIDVQLSSDRVVTISNRGAVVFSPGAVLLVGMLLNDSKPARSLRKRIINSLQIRMTDEVARTATKKTKTPVNIRRQISREMVLQYCRDTKGNIVTTWSQVYNELKVSHGVDLEQRKLDSGKQRAPLAEFLSEDEQLLVIAIIVAMFRIEEKEVPSLIQDLGVELPELESFSIKKQLTYEEYMDEQFLEEHNRFFTLQGVTSTEEMREYLKGASTPEWAEYVPMMFDERDKGCGGMTCDEVAQFLFGKKEQV